MESDSRNKSPATQTLVFVSFVGHSTNDILSKKVSLMPLGEEILETGVCLLDKALLECRESENGHGTVVHHHRVHAGIGTGMGELVLHVACEHHVAGFKEFVVVGEVEDM